jgi:multidrug efflux pump subunit AcrA (membrane-fusion protein)
MGVRVAFLSAQPAAAPAAALTGVLVPAEAVQGPGDAGTVFVYADGKVERRAVSLGQTVGTDREVTKNLRAGERVVVAPPPSLKGGDAVRLAEAGK